MSSLFDVGSVYSFEVYPSALLGTNWQNVKVAALVNYQTGIAMGQDLTAQHINVFPTLPSGTPDDPEATNYVVLETASGRTILGVSWINPATIAQVNARKCTVVLENMTADKVTALRNALVSNGFTIFSLTLNAL